jgi:hypothetical protein
VEEGSDGIELVEVPPTQHGTRNDAADRIYRGYGREGFVIIDAIFLLVAFDYQSRFPNSISPRFEHPIAANDPIPSWNFFRGTFSHIPCSRREAYSFRIAAHHSSRLGPDAGSWKVEGSTSFAGVAFNAPVAYTLPTDSRRRREGFRRWPYKE